MKTKINKNRGISLIVLVITIIIMIILATAVILSLNSSNLIDKATLAKYKSDLSSLQEIIVAKVAERQLSNQDTSGRYVLSDWGIENSEYEDKVIIENSKLVLRVTDNESLKAAATELGISTVSSSDTTTLANTRGLNLLNYRIYGNSVQDGTPTPESPVEVLSLGETIKNLAIIKSTIINSSTITSDINPGRNPDIIPVISDFIDVSDFPITISLRSNNTATTRFRMIEYDEDKTYLTQSYIFAPQTSEYRYLTVNSATLTNASTKYIKIAIYERSYASYPVNNWNIQIKQCSTATDYRPNRYIDVVSSGKNLFDKDNAILLGEGIYVPSQTDATNQLINGSYNRVISLYIQCKHNTTYTVNQFLPVTANSRLRTATTVDVPAQNVFVTNKSGLSDWDGNPVTITSSNNDNYLVVQFCNLQTPYTNEELLSNLQIEENAIATGYEPYQEVTTTIDLTGHEPLRKIGDVADYIDYKNKKIVRKVGYKTINFKEYSYTEETKYLYLKNDTSFSDMKQNTLNCISNKIKTFKTFPGSKNNNALMVNGSSFYYFVVAEKDEEQSYINNLNNVTIYYELKKPIEESFECPAIPTLKGTTILSIKDENNIQPSNIITEY